MTSLTSFEALKAGDALRLMERELPRVTFKKYSIWKPAEKVKRGVVRRDTWLLRIDGTIAGYLRVEHHQSFGGSRLSRSSFINPGALGKRLGVYPVSEGTILPLHHWRKVIARMLAKALHEAQAASVAPPGRSPDAPPTPNGKALHERPDAPRMSNALDAAISGWIEQLQGPRLSRDPYADDFVSVLHNARAEIVRATEPVGRSARA